MALIGYYILSEIDGLLDTRCEKCYDILNERFSFSNNSLL